MASLADSAYLEGGSLYYSDLPIRSELQREKYRHWGRRILFYIHLAYFVTATVMFPFLITNLTFWFWLIHTLWFELDVTTNKNNIFIQLLHAVSFVGSYIVMITATILLVILNPDFISQRAEMENHSVAFAWLLNVWIHYIPPILLTLDLFLHKEHIRKRHRITFNRNSPSKKVILKDTLKVIWAIIAPMGVCAAWMLAGYTPENVYHVTNYSYTYLIPIMCATDVIFAVIFLFIVKKRKDTYIRLN
ncbi:hypothetical protein DFA_01746 [Cavenderia fasciculata]|uniref:Transmembrane protein n=1 Tax=Cavenderia fasciculata TaxID=261658 RepID=F4PUJ6_CACFS|nr:uncharacterized protein DFA_01746 [Cavenderia fasciculata]EGG21860.1 hypothetical protein DFA_01746 [Cavenderia fasciculata]|eukprot:XP_004359711.1 hypothetical protein DFA_01746 [Cavenderia fasciculata]